MDDFSCTDEEFAEAIDWIVDIKDALRLQVDGGYPSDVYLLACGIAVIVTEDRHEDCGAVVEFYDAFRAVTWHRAALEQGVDKDGFLPAPYDCYCPGYEHLMKGED